MNAYEYILSKQIQWALNHNIKLIGSKNDRGRAAYTSKLEDNLFEPLLESTVHEFQQGDGNELQSDSPNPVKMSAVHSSSALSVNMFQHWKGINQISSIASACRLCTENTKISTSISFEKKFKIDESFKIHPNIDVVINNNEGSKYKVYAIECKFSEAYSAQRHGGIKEKYIDLKEIWHDIPNLYELA